MNNILLVDDNENFREVLIDLFASNNMTQYRFLEAGTPVEALELFHRNESGISYIICDCFLPIQNGIDLLEMIHAKNPKIPCFLISGDANALVKKNIIVDKIYSKLELNELIQTFKQLSYKKVI